MAATATPPQRPRLGCPRWTWQTASRAAVQPSAPDMRRRRALKAMTTNTTEGIPTMGMQENKQAAQDAYAEQLRGAGLVICLGSMLHSIATGNMLPSWVKIVCVDINPAVATKVSDRGTGQAVGVVADVGLFLDLLSKALA